MLTIVGSCHLESNIFITGKDETVAIQTVLARGIQWPTWDEALRHM